ncbi:acyltransferase family protein [Rhodopseudomonas pseudopalustris]|uniref:acyltransferase family protein n=1 Tax=Rhodopseudomonas pseudopalustris TaxID=1513892 RepID=UPI0011143540|nr:acyltransferase [Rhodopseudomonas pseudopalustris]
MKRIRAFGDDRKTPSNSDYRPDIDGLGPLSVLGVIANHFGFPNITGGFTGVDAFFVVSGFRITRLIVDVIRSNRVFWADFYVRRFRRILPVGLGVVRAAPLVSGRCVRRL